MCIVQCYSWYSQKFNIHRDSCSYFVNKSSVGVVEVPCTEWAYDDSIYSSTLTSDVFLLSFRLYRHLRNRIPTQLETVHCQALPPLMYFVLIVTLRPWLLIRETQFSSARLDFFIGIVYAFGIHSGLGIYISNHISDLNVSINNHIHLKCVYSELYAWIHPLVIFYLSITHPIVKHNNSFSLKKWLYQRQPFTQAKS